jgi:hypothetical protein
MHDSRRSRSEAPIDKRASSNRTLLHREGIPRYPAHYVLDPAGRFRAKHWHTIFVFILVAFGVVVGSSVALAAQLTLSWVDNAAGQASFIIQRATGTAGAYTELAQTPLGAVGYVDTTVSVGTTYCYRVAAVNDFGGSDYSNVACGSPAGAVTLTVTNMGRGGVVESSPVGITCGSSCSAKYLNDSVVLLTAIPDRQAQFKGWSGGGCSGTGSCIVTLQANVTVTATFAKGRKK